jgi:hypothetical protein
MSTPVFILLLLVYIGAEATFALRSDRDPGSPLAHAWGWRTAAVLLVLIGAWSGWPFWVI